MGGGGQGYLCLLLIRSQPIEPGTKQDIHVVGWTISVPCGQSNWEWNGVWLFYDTTHCTLSLFYCAQWHRTFYCTLQLTWAVTFHIWTSHAPLWDAHYDKIMMNKLMFNRIKQLAPKSLGWLDAKSELKINPYFPFQYVMLPINYLIFGLKNSRRNSQVL